MSVTLEDCKKLLQKAYDTQNTDIREAYKYCKEVTGLW